MGTYSFDQLQQIWIRNGGSPATARIAAAVAMGESSGDPQATNRNTDGSVDRGLWQINSVHGGLSTYDVDANARAAIQISNKGTNWKPWVAFTNGSYRKFLVGSAGSPVSGTTPVTNADPALDWNPLDGFGFADKGLSNLGDDLAKGLENGIVAALKSILGPVIQWGWWLLETGLGFGLVISGVFLVAQKSSVVTGIEKAVLSSGGPEGEQLAKVVPENETAQEGK